MNVVDKASFVGVTIDKHLTWKDHIKDVNNCIRKKAGILFKLRNVVPKYIFVLLYKAFIQPNITYGLEVWGSTFPSYLNPILITQKMCVRSILHSLASKNRLLVYLWNWVFKIFINFIN